MKLISNCTLIATTLSARYRSYETYDPNNYLESFLEQNGILLTMCMANRGSKPWEECYRSSNDTKIEASWIQANKTGFRVVEMPVDHGVPVGIVLKPTATSIRCIYPFDAASLSRDNDGCGPVSNDVRYGSEGYDQADQEVKEEYQKQIISYKNQMHGINTTWDSIPCRNFFVGPIPTVGTSILADVNDKHEWTYQTSISYLVDQCSYVMGYDICNQSDPTPLPIFDKSNFLLYTGPASWPSKDWNKVIELMGDSLTHHGDIEIWNELVIRLETTFSKAVEAVFYVETNETEKFEREIAQREARKLNKPLLYVDIDEKDGDLFHCAERLSSTAQL